MRLSFYAFRPSISLLETKMPLPKIERIRRADTPIGKHPLLSGRLAAELAEEEYERLKTAAISSAKKLLEKPDGRAHLNADAEAHNQFLVSRLEGGQPIHMFTPLLAAEASREAVAPIEAANREKLLDIARDTAAQVYGLDREQLDKLIAHCDFRPPRRHEDFEEPEPREPEEERPEPRFRIPFFGRRHEQEPEEHEEPPPPGWVPMGEMIDIGERPENDAELQHYIDKRRTHNALIQGSAIHHMTDAIALAKTALDKIDPRLYPHYRHFANCAQLTQFLGQPDRPPDFREMMLPVGPGNAHPPGMPPLPGMRPPPGMPGMRPPPGMPGMRPPRGMQGMHGGLQVPIASEMELDMRGARPRLFIHGTTFPLILQELSKGLSEINMAHGLPYDWQVDGEGRVDEILKQADAHPHEHWYFMLGPPMARKLFLALGKHKGLMSRDPADGAVKNQAYTRTVMSLLPKKELHSGIKAILSAEEPAEQKKAVQDFKKRLEEAEESFMH